jgi:hypothetical protein
MLDEHEEARDKKTQPRKKVRTSVLEIITLFVIQYYSILSGAEPAAHERRSIPATCAFSKMKTRLGSLSSIMPVPLNKDLGRPGSRHA